jgi:uncharacterized protein YcaQ
VIKRILGPLELELTGDLREAYDAAFPLRLKADRKASGLRVQASHAEPGVAKPRVAPALGAELARMAAWLGLERVEIIPKGDLAAGLRKGVKPR